MPPSLSAALAISTLGLSGALWAASPNLSTEIVAEGLSTPGPWLSCRMGATW